ncbi:hypothetical protein ACFQRL_11310 [Microbacterium fluvii]|uniref:Uncharacterized protein n=1 Tax=Microbacterium fluvii TaxID=415215 RepID=A0ABW2HEI9_9MICO
MLIARARRRRGADIDDARERVPCQDDRADAVALTVGPAAVGALGVGGVGGGAGFFAGTGARAAMRCE